MHWVVLGVGVNLNARAEDFPAELRGEATSLAHRARAAGAAGALPGGLLYPAGGVVDRHAEEGFGPVREAWRERSVTLGREVLVQRDGREVAAWPRTSTTAGRCWCAPPAGWSGSLRRRRMVRPRR